MILLTQALYGVYNAVIPIFEAHFACDDDVAFESWVTTERDAMRADNGLSIEEQDTARQMRFLNREHATLQSCPPSMQDHPPVVTTACNVAWPDHVPIQPDYHTVSAESTIAVEQFRLSKRKHVMLQSCSTTPRDDSLVVATTTESDASRSDHVSSQPRPGCRAVSGESLITDAEMDQVILAICACEGTQHARLTFGHTAFTTRNIETDKIVFAHVVNALAFSTEEQKIAFIERRLSVDIRDVIKHDVVRFRQLQALLTWQQHGVPPPTQGANAHSGAICVSTRTQGVRLHGTSNFPAPPTSPPQS